MSFKLFFAVLAPLIILFGGCASSQNVFTNVGDNVASPSSMYVDSAASRLYLVNSNSEVSYNWQQGNFQVLDISDPLSPVLIKSVVTKSYSGNIYYDAAAKKAYVPNRYSTNNQVTEDVMYAFDLDESSPATLLDFTESTVGQNAYDIVCCYPPNNAWISTSANKVQRVDLSGTLTPFDQTLLTPIDSGGEITYAETYHLALNGNQLFVSRYYGGVEILNLDESGVPGANAVNYVIYNVNFPRDIIYDAGSLYVVGEGVENDSYIRYLMQIDVSSLTPFTGGRDAIGVDKDAEGLVVATVEVGTTPSMGLITTDYIFVTNFGDNTVSAIDRGSMTKVADIDVGENPFSLALYQDGTGTDKYVYVGNVSANTIDIIDIATLSVVAVYP